VSACIAWRAQRPFRWNFRVPGYQYVFVLALTQYQSKLDCLLIPQQGNKLKYVVLKSRIHNLCQAIDAGVPLSEFVLRNSCCFVALNGSNVWRWLSYRRVPACDWSSVTPLHPGPCTLDPSELAQLMLAIESSRWESTRARHALRLKDVCLHQANRSALLAQFKEQLVKMVQSMLNDSDQHVVRLAIFALQNFAIELKEYVQLARSSRKVHKGHLTEQARVTSVVFDSGEDYRALEHQFNPKLACELHTTAVKLSL
jgi:hypothetical protein